MPQIAGDDVAAGDISIAREGALARVELARVKALNALTTAMRGEIAAAIPRFARDANLYAVVLRSASPKAFSAGGDVRELIAWSRTDPARAKAAFADEYRLNWTLECFSKPTVSLIDGLVMGSGVGISMYNTHRVAGEGYKFAMPETAIGLFPDVGAAHALSRLPDEIGTYLGLTGRSIGRADAFALGLATHCISGDRFAAIETALADAQTIDPLLDGLHRDPGKGELAPVAGLIGDCFSAATVEDIVERLQGVTGAGAEFAAGILADLARRSPTSLKITLRHLREARNHTLSDVLAADYRLACRCLDGHDFAEGVRAALIDKDNLPVWKPATLAEVREEQVAAHFAPFGLGHELELPTRKDMQAARV
jgi:enoyl-CoA hydratase